MPMPLSPQTTETRSMDSVSDVLRINQERRWKKRNRENSR
jgi:hypothetical protein